jgi:hypothetical protein
MGAYDGWACSIEVHVFTWEVLKPRKKVFDLKFEYAIHYNNELLVCILPPFASYFNNLDLYFEEYKLKF